MASKALHQNQFQTRSPVTTKLQEVSLVMKFTLYLTLSQDQTIKRPMETDLHRVTFINHFRKKELKNSQHYQTLIKHYVFVLGALLHMCTQCFIPHSCRPRTWNITLQRCCLTRDSCFCLGIYAQMCAHTLLFF